MRVNHRAQLFAGAVGVIILYKAQCGADGRQKEDDARAETVAQKHRYNAQQHQHQNKFIQKRLAEEHIPRNRLRAAHLIRAVLLQPLFRLFAGQPRFGAVQRGQHFGAGHASILFVVLFHLCIRVEIFHVFHRRSPA